jgi:hypothetical protein
VPLPGNRRNRVQALHRVAAPDIWRIDPPDVRMRASSSRRLMARAVMRQSGRTFSACGPFCPWVVSNSTFWFSSSDL